MRAARHHGRVDFTFTGELWQWSGEAGWHFISLPEAVTDDIDARFEGSRRGFGSLRVQVTLGQTTWSTSIFPDSKSATYVLPVKRQVRDAEHLSVGDRTDVRLHLESG